MDAWFVCWSTGTPEDGGWVFDVYLPWYADIWNLVVKAGGSARTLVVYFYSTVIGRTPTSVSFPTLTLGLDNIWAQVLGFPTHALYFSTNRQVAHCHHARINSGAAGRQADEERDG